MRFYLYQVNGRLGDMQANAQKILSFAQSKEKESCTLLPSLPLIYHPYTEISHIGGFSERIEKACYNFAKSSSEQHCGNILYESLKINTLCWNSLGPIYSQIQDNEYIQIGTIKIFAPHCLDVNYSDTDFADFLKKLCIPQQADFIYLATAHTFYDGFSMQNILCEFAQKQQKPVVYVNACGASDGTVFSGQSMLINAQGKILIQLRPFCEDSAYFDYDGKNLQAEDKQLLDFQTQNSSHADGLLFLAAQQAVADYASKIGIKRAVIGLSGGMDSALVAAITCEAMSSKNVTGIIMPSRYNSQMSMDDAIKLANNLGMPYHIIPISDITHSFENALAASFATEEAFYKENDTTFENIQARTRGNLLTAFANRIGAMVIGTGNKSESAMGYCTLYGDTVGALEPIADIYKSRVYNVARWFNEFKNQEYIPQNVFIKAPTAELRPDQKDEDSLPPYPYLDKVLHQLLEEGKNPKTIIEEHLSNDDIKLIYHRLKTSEFKRKQCPFPVILSSCPFGKKWNPSSSANVF